MRGQTFSGDPFPLNNLDLHRRLRSAAAASITASRSHTAGAGGGGGGGGGSTSAAASSSRMGKANGDAVDMDLLLAGSGALKAVSTPIVALRKSNTKPDK